MSAAIAPPAGVPASGCGGATVARPADFGISSSGRSRRAERVASRTPQQGWRAVLLSIVAALALSGCVTQQLVIRTNPPGAAVTIDGQALKDPTPVTHPFLWYKTMTIRVEHPGYQPLEAQERIWTPWWMIFPLDGLWTLLPVPFKDERVFTYTLQRGGGVPPTSSPGATP